MTREMAIEIFKKQQSLCLRENDWYKALTMAIEALQMESCEDAISRQAVIEQTYNWSKDEFLRTTNAFDHLRRKIKVLPPVTPQPKIGTWKYIQYDKPSIGNWHCSECGRIVFLLRSQKSNETPLYDYCPWCGVKMEMEET